MTSKALIMIGKSGSGKGTQAELLIQKLQAKGHDIEHIEMGDAFRNFLRESNYTATQALRIAQNGGLQPDFLANYFLAEELIKYTNGNRDFILDGTPRTKRQARIVDGALRFYGIEQPIVVHITVSDDLVIERMKERGRNDDELHAIQARLDWYQHDTMRAVEFFKDHSEYYRYIELDGEQSIEEIHENLMQQLDI